MEKQKIEVVTVPRYELETILINTMRKYDRIKTLEEKKIDKLLTKSQASKELGVCYNTLISLIKKGYIKTSADSAKILQSSIEAYKSAKK